MHADAAQRTAIERLLEGGVVLPQGIILKRGDLGATTRFRVSQGIEYDHSGQYMAVGPFEYAWP